MKVHAELVTSSAHDDELEGDAKKPEEKMESPTDGNPIVEQTAIRAVLPKSWNEHYLPMDPLRRLYSEHWQAWQVKKPFWLTPKLEKIILKLFGDVIDAATRRDDDDQKDGDQDDGAE